MAALKNLIFVLAVCCASSTCPAQQIAILIPGGSDLRIQNTEQVNSPFPELKNFNASLNQQGVNAPGATGPFTVEASRYLIIPKQTLLAAYNAAFENGHQRILSDFMRNLANHITRYAGAANTDCLNPSTATGIVQARNLAIGISSLWVYHQNSFRVPPGSAPLDSYYAWIPGNSYIGPTRRSDLPANNQIDVRAQNIVGRSRWDRLNRIFINLREYVSSKQALFLSTAVTELTQVAISHDESQPLNPAQWQLVNGEYSINLNAPTPAADAEQKPPSNAALNSDSCANLNPTLDQMRQRLITTLF